ncbi:MAG TPA: hypothetical protein VF092_02785 [Longimicrobium sp.]
MADENPVIDAPAPGAVPSPDGAAAGAPPRPAPRARATRRVMVQTRPFMFTATGERVELPPDEGDAEEPAVDASALDTLSSEDAPPAPGGSMTRSSGPPPLAPGARMVHSEGGRQVFVNPDGPLRVSSRPTPGVAAAARPADPAAPAPVLEPLAAVASPAPEPAPASPIAPPPEAVPAPARAEAPAAAPSPVQPIPPSPVPVIPASPVRAAETAATPVDIADLVAAAAISAPEGEDDLGRSDAANVEIRSEEIDEILSSMPGGLVRWGITAVFGTVCLLLAIGAYIAWPDVVNGRISVTTPTPPVRLVARNGGEVARVLAVDGAKVRGGAPLVLLKNPADYADVQAVSAALDRLEPALQRAGPLPDLSFPRPLTLGTLQSAFSALQQAYADFRLARDELFYTQKLATARQQVADLQVMHDRLQAQQALLEQQLAVAERARDRTRVMVERGLTAATDQDRSDEDYLQKRYAVENGRSTLANNEVQLSAQRSALLDLEQRRSDEGQRGLVALRNAHHAMRAAITQWEQENVLRAPSDGTVSFFRELHENQFVGAAEPLVAVVSSASGLVGRATLSGAGAGKVKPGQRVIIRMESYPYREYGTVDGRVVRVSQLGFQADANDPGSVTYQVEVSLPKGLVTSYGRRLDFHQEMRGDMDVVTQDMSLLARLVNKVRAAGGGG